MHACNHLGHENYQNFHASLVYTLSLRTAWAIGWDPVSGQDKTKNKNKASQLLLVFILRTKSNPNSKYPIAKKHKNKSKGVIRVSTGAKAGDGLELGGVSRWGLFLARWGKGRAGDWRWRGLSSTDFLNNGWRQMNKQAVRAKQ